MGINIPTRDELIANKLKPDELAKYVGKSIANEKMNSSEWKAEQNCKTLFLLQVPIVCAIWALMD